MHKELGKIALAAFVAMLVVGCGSTEAAPEKKEDREAFSSTKPFDINDVPEKDRPAVRARLGLPPEDGSAPAGPTAPAPSGGGN